MCILLWLLYYGITARDDSNENRYPLYVYAVHIIIIVTVLVYATYYYHCVVCAIHIEVLYALRLDKICIITIIIIYYITYYSHVIVCDLCIVRV